MDRSALGPVRLGTTLRAPIATTRHAALRTIDPREKRRAQDAHGQQYDAHHETHRRDVEFESSVTAEKPDMSRPNVNEPIFVDISIPSRTKAREKSEARRRISVKPW